MQILALIIIFLSTLCFLPRQEGKFVFDRAKNESFTQRTVSGQNHLLIREA